MSDDSTETTAETTAAETTTTTATAATTTSTTETWDEDRARATILKQREKEKADAAVIRDLKAKADKLAELEAAQLSDQEKALKRAEEAEAKAAQADHKLRTANLLVELAKTDGVINAKAAAKLIEGVEFDDTGEPTNLAERVEAMFSDYPELKATTSSAQTSVKAPNVNAGGTTTATDGPKLEPEEVRMAESLGMTPEKYAALKQVRTAEDYQKLTAAQQT